MQIYNPQNGGNQDSHVTIGGKTYRGNSVQVLNGKVIVDGKVVDHLNNGSGNFIYNPQNGGNVNANAVGGNANVNVTAGNASVNVSGNGSVFASAGGADGMGGQGGVGGVSGSYGYDSAAMRGQGLNYQTMSKQQFTGLIAQVASDMRSRFDARFPGRIFDDATEKDLGYHICETARLAVIMDQTGLYPPKMKSDYDMHVDAITGIYNDGIQNNDVQNRATYEVRKKKKKKEKKPQIPESKSRDPDDLEGRLIDLLE